jgi:hypothetical protein
MAKAKAKAKAKASTKPRAKAKSTAKAKPKAKAKKGSDPISAAARKPKAKAKKGSDPISATNARLRTKPRAKQSGGGQIVQILDDDHPLDALRRYLASFDGNASEQQGQVALGSAQLMLFAIEREHRGGDEVKQLIDLVLSRWGAFPEPDGFHAQGFLRNAFAAIGDDRARLSELVQLVPAEASPELRYNIAAAYAFVGDKPALLPALERALDAGASPDQILRDTDFAAFVRDPDVEAMLARAGVPEIPVDIDPHLRPVRAALDSAMATLRRFGEKPELAPPATLERVLAAEHAARIQLPNDYRALLTLSDAPRLFEFAFVGTGDLSTDSDLSRSSRAYLAARSENRSGVGACVPLAKWGQPTDWLLYDPMGNVRGGNPGYVLLFDDGQMTLRDLVHAFERLEQAAADELGTN